MTEYLEASFDIALRCLKPGGSLLCKVLQGEELKPLVTRAKPLFGGIKGGQGGALLKPPASRSGSREMYLLCRGFRPENAHKWSNRGSVDEFAPGIF